MITLPRKQPFTFEKNKDLRKTYAQITLFLCSLKDDTDSEPEQTSETCCSDMNLSNEWNEWLNDKDITETFPAVAVFSIIL